MLSPRQEGDALMLVIVLERLGLVRTNIFSERRVPAVPLMVLLSLCGACATGLLAQIRIQLPFTPVPVTGQVLSVLICGSLLGAGYGALSQLMYFAFGAMGIPWFAGGVSGIGVLAGVTGGYLIGFAVAALFLGACTEHWPGARRLGGQVICMLIATAVIYFFGALHLALALGLGFAKAIALGVAPFIFGDVLKALLAAMFTTAVLPSGPSGAGRR